MKSGKATPFFRNGVFCVRLNVEPSGAQTQDIAVGIDPGSKKEGFTVKSEKSTYLNVQTDAHNKVSKKVETRRQLRRSRRSRKCPNRKHRTNRMANKQRLPAGHTDTVGLETPNPQLPVHDVSDNACLC